MTTPGTHGLELRECLRNLVPSVPILYLSAYAYHENVRSGNPPEPADYVVKPFKVDTLLGRVREALSQAPRQHGNTH
jgi:DNA-binding response OmpR family regulator